MKGLALKDKLEAIKGYKQVAAANALGLKANAFNNRLTRNSEFSDSEIVLIAEAVGRPVSFFTGSGTDQLQEPAITYDLSSRVLGNLSIEVLQAKLIAVQEDMISVCKDNMKDKARIIDLQDEKLKRVVNGGQKVSK